MMRLNLLGEGNGNPLQYSCLENPMDGGAWEAIDHGVAKSRTRLSDFTFKVRKTRNKSYWFSSFLVHPCRHPIWYFSSVPQVAAATRTV